MAVAGGFGRGLAWLHWPQYDGHRILFQIWTETTPDLRLSGDSFKLAGPPRYPPEPLGYC